MRFSVSDWSKISQVHLIYLNDEPLQFPHHFLSQSLHLVRFNIERSYLEVKFCPDGAIYSKSGSLPLITNQKFYVTFSLIFHFLVSSRILSFFHKIKNYRDLFTLILGAWQQFFLDKKNTRVYSKST